MARVVLAVAALLAAGCDELFGIDYIEPPPPVVVTCTDSVDCSDNGTPGTCECGYCSYPDAQCPVTSRRFAVGAAVSGGCVPALDSLDAGVYHQCARMTDGTAWCWGWNLEGQLGRGATLTVDSGLPILVESGGAAMTGIEEIVGAATHTCARLETGRVVCWGDNRFGQLGASLPIGIGSRSEDPVEVLFGTAPLEDVTKIVSSFWHVCALVGSGALSSLVCWGDNARHQLGTDAGGTSNVARLVTNLPPGELKDISVGGDTTCAIIDTDGVGPFTPKSYCWGRQLDGRLGNNMLGEGNVETPARVEWMNDSFGLPDVTVIEGGHTHTCAIKRPNGELYCWGNDIDNKLGNDTALTNVAVASRVMWPNGDYQRVGLGERHTCATFGPDTLCWGYDGDGRIGNGPTTSTTVQTPFAVITGLPTRDLAVGFEHTCVLGSDRTLHCWGSNSRGQLGVGDPANRDAPTEVLPAAFCRR